MAVTLGILDWGIGGLGFYRALKASRPDVEVLYWSDAGAVPYGQMSRRALAARVREVSRRMAGEGATHLVIACNAASTVLDAAVMEHKTGVIDHGVRAALASGARVVGVIGGARTVRSGIHRRQLQEAGVEVRQRIAQPLSAAVESGELDSPELRATIARILRPLADVDALLMACTHYPVLASHFSKVLGATTLVDPVTATLAWVEAAWLTETRPAHGVPDRFVTTGPAQSMRRSALASFGVEVVAVESRSV